MLVDISLGAALWKKASAEISNALIHITMPLLNANGLDFFDFVPAKCYTEDLLYMIYELFGY